jgi:hypothetical protein
MKSNKSKSSGPKNVKVTAVKTKMSGPKNPKPNDPYDTEKELRMDNVKQGIKNAVKVVGPMATAAVAAFKKPKYARVDAKGGRQLNSANRKESRANKLSGRAEEMAEVRPMKAARLEKRSVNLKEKADKLRGMGEANKKAAEKIYAIKQNKKK